MFPRQISGNSSAERFTDQINWLIGREQHKGLIGGAVEADLTRLAWPILVARVFDDEDIQRRGLLNGVGIVAALESAACVAVGDKNLALRRLGWTQSLPADGFARWTGPTLQFLRGSVFLDLFRSD